MAFQIKSFAEVLKMSKEALDEALAPVRARAAKAKADLVSAKIEEDMIDLERKIHEACAAKELDFDKIIGLIDKYDLAERKKGQVSRLIDELFPSKG